MRYIVDITEEQKNALDLLGITFVNEIPSFEIGDVVRFDKLEQYYDVVVTKIDKIHNLFSGIVIYSSLFPYKKGGTYNSFDIDSFHKIKYNEQT